MTLAHLTEAAVRLSRVKKSFGTALLPAARGVAMVFQSYALLNRRDPADLHFFDAAGRRLAPQEVFA